MCERANGRASGPVLTSRFSFVPDHSAAGDGVKAEAVDGATMKAVLNDTEEDRMLGPSASAWP